MSKNNLHRFLFKHLNIRGQHLHLTDAWQALIKDRHYPPLLTQLLGELTAISVMLANGMKHTGKLTLQIIGKGPITLLVIEVTHDLKIKGIAKTQGPLPKQATLDTLLNSGQILVTLDNDQTQTLYQSHVPAQGKSVAEAFQTFMTQSDQLDTQLWLAADNQAAAGLLLQKMPETDTTAQDQDGWHRINLLANTLKPKELLTLDCQTLLHRLFHEETIELFPPQTVQYQCRHDKAKIDAMLLSLGQKEIEAILEKEGEIVIHNEMCNQYERYNKEAIQNLFAKAQIDTTQTKQ